MTEKCTKYDSYMTVTEIGQRKVINDRLNHQKRFIKEYN
ncbi:Uncharacterised protein [Yersinia aldovae]|uniref:Uncharacterized protein n=1 Tax=Yersinia aldovae TaxID=29483 RepID=A0A0T9US13_YERAL|nr:Uncharacterised protein [Yersinia aldovae]CNK62603.1 Uncharacterised protein [Yersinia aldovae]CNL62979.1 Uncharacterised protein [Yersinia aldovae]